MARDVSNLFDSQLIRLKEYHFLLLYWVAKAESVEKKYNITYAFDDLKRIGITRTKQNVMAYIDGLVILCFIDLIEEQNRKNLYITKFGAKALERLVKQNTFSIKPSSYLEETK